MDQSVGGYIFWKSNEEIVVRSPKSKASFYFIELFIVLSCLLCVFWVTIYTNFTLVEVAVASRLPRREDTFSSSALMHDKVLFDIPVSLLALYLQFDNGTNTASFMTSSLCTFILTCAATQILHRVCGSNLFVL